MAEIGVNVNLPQQDKNKLYSLLCTQSTMMCSYWRKENEEKLEMKIDTGDVMPKRQPVRRTLLLSDKKITTQLKQMQDQNVIAIL